MKKFNFFFLSILFIVFCYVMPIEKVCASNQVKITTVDGTKNSNIYYKDNVGEQINVSVYTYKIGEADAYCLHPGRVGPGNTTYYEDETFDVSNCNKEFTYECGLAFILSESLANDYSYRATETALRLFAAYSSDESSEMIGSDGWYDAETGLTVKAQIYKKTAQAVMNWGYNVDNINHCYDKQGNEIGCVNVLYGTGEQAEDLKNGIELFKKVMTGGIENKWVPKIELVDTEKKENGNIIFTLNTNFNKNTKISIPDTILGYPIDKSITNCDNGCVIKLTVNAPNVDEDLFINFNITFEDIRYSLGTIKRYKPAGGKAQYFLSYLTTPITNVYPLQYTVNSEITSCCIGESVNKDMPLSCDESTTGEISDPKMCSILNSCAGSGDMSYNKTKDAGLNSKYCSMYCREEMHFTFMDRTEVIAGRQFKYDILRNDTYLSTVVKGYKECVVDSINFGQWEIDYLEKNKQVLEYFNQWKLWETRANNEIAHNEVDYIKCENCSIEDNANNEKTVKWTWYSWPVRYYGHTTASYYGKGYISNYSTSRQSTSSGTNRSGSDNSNCECDDCSIGASCRPDSGTSAKIEAEKYKKLYDTAINERDQLIYDIKNCNLMTGTSAYNYVSAYKINNLSLDISYEDKYSEFIEIQDSDVVGDVTITYFNLTGDDGNDETTTDYWSKINNLNILYDGSGYCSGCGGEANISSSIKTKEIDKWDCSNSGTSARCVLEKVEVPVTNAAKSEATSTKNFVQNATLYTQLFTGEVSNKPSGVGYWVGLEDYVYPIELNKENGEYNVNVSYKFSNDLVRFSQNEFNCAFKVINELTMYECDSSVENCYVDCNPLVEVCDDYGELKSGLGVIVRSVDLSDLFPTNRAIGMNWANSLNVINAIQSLGNDIWINKQPQYVIELSPSNIRNIKNYNNYNDYLDYSINCDSSLNCTSNFLTSISSNTNYAYYVDLSLGRNKRLDDFNNYYKYGR